MRNEKINCVEKAVKEHVEQGEGTPSESLPSPQQTPQFRNSWEISFSWEKDDFVVYINVEMTKTDCITQKKGVS